MALGFVGNEEKPKHNFLLGNKKNSFAFLADVHLNEEYVRFGRLFKVNFLAKTYVEPFFFTLKVKKKSCVGFSLFFDFF